MSRMNQLFLATSLGLMLAISTSTLLAQDAQGGRRQRQRNTKGGERQRQGNFDPAQLQQRILERYKERLEITDEPEWKAIQPLIQKVLDARIAVDGGARGMLGDGNRVNQAQGTSRALVASPTAAERLRKAVDSKAPAAEVKAALVKYSEYRKEKQADLEKAQTALRGVLTARQEAIATLSGLL